MTNNAKTPYPNGLPADPLTSKIMKIIVGSNPLPSLVQNFNTFVTELKIRLNVLNPTLTPNTNYFPTNPEFNVWPFTGTAPLPTSLSTLSNFVIKDTAYPKFH